MRHMLFAASFGGVLVVLAGPVLSAQTVPASKPVSNQVPGRALLDFPIGTLGEAPALSVAGGGGLFDPAAILLQPLTRLRLSVALLDGPGDRGVHGRTAAATARVTRSTALGVSFARVGVSDIERTGASDPQVIGPPIQYSTYVVSVVGARRIGGPFRNHLVIGAAGRYRAAQVDTLEASTNAVDVGIIADRLLGRVDARLAASSYLWRPGNEAADPPGIHTAFDARFAGPDASHEARIGLARDITRGGPSETFLFTSARWRYAEARGGIATARNFDSRQTLVRFGLSFRSDRFVVGIGREDTSPSFGPMYQFSLSTLIN